MSDEGYPSIQDRVKAGAAFLDEKSFGWEDKINLDNFDFGSGRQCILAQLFPLNGDYDYGYPKACKVFGLTHTWEEGNQSKVVLLGFLWRKSDFVERPAGIIYEDSPDYPRIGFAWRDFIEARQLHNKIARRAYEISQSPECGSQDDNWFRAVAELTAGPVQTN